MKPSAGLTYNAPYLLFYNNPALQENQDNDYPIAQ